MNFRMNFNFLKATSTLILFAAIVGLGACGRKHNNINRNAPAPSPPPSPNVNNYNVNNTMSGCIGTVNNNGNFVWFGGSYDTVREQYLPSYQCMYSNIRVATEVKIGNISIPAKTYAWKELYDLVTNAMRSCCVIGSATSSAEIWASLDYYSIEAYYNSGYLSGSYVGNSEVTFDRQGIRTDFDNLLALFTSLNSQYYYALSGYDSNIYYYGPQPQYGNNNFFGGLSYSSGGGLSLSLGGSFNF